MIKIGIIGTGYWGKQHLRVLSELKCNLIGISDLDSSKKELADEYKVSFFLDYKKLVDLCDALIIVTPPKTHYELAKYILNKNRHVFLEKPFVTNVKHAGILKQLSKSKKLVCMSGHTFLYHPAIRKIKDLIKIKALGNIYYLIFQWLNLGIIRSDVNALWNFAPHPFSILYYFFGTLPDKISAVGKSYIQKKIEDVASINAVYDNTTLIQINLSWLHPIKVRQISIVGSQKLVVFDDVQNEQKLRVFYQGIHPLDNNRDDYWKSFSEFQNKIKSGKVETINAGSIEPLRAELQNFLDCIKYDKNPVSGINEGIAVLKMLEASEKSLKKGGAWIVP